MVMTDEKEQLRQEQDNSKEETLRLLYESDHALKTAQEVITQARERLLKAAQKYEERLHGPNTT